MKPVSTPSVFKRILQSGKSCTLFLSLFLLLFQQAGFAQQYQRVYANSETHSSPQKLLILTLSEVVDAANAVDGNPQTFSTLRTNIGALALIEASQNLRFTGADKPTATTPVTLKIGFGSNVLDLLGGITVQATLNGTGVGTAYSGNQLLGLLGGANQSEITFTPGVNYDGVKISVSPTLGVGVTANIFHAYFLKAATGICASVPLDELHGVGKYITSVDAAGIGGSVVNALNAIDGDEATSATVNAAVGVAAYTQETVLFSSPSMPGDSVQIIVSTPGALVELDLLNAIQIETFNGSVSNGTVDATSALLKLRLLSGATNKAVLSFVPTGVFDRVQFRLGGLASVLSSLNLFEIKMPAPVPVINIGGVAGVDTAIVCMDSAVVLSVANPETGTTYTWWDAETGGNQIASGTSYTVPKGQTLGIHTYYVQGLRSNCTVATDRAKAVINVVQTTQPTITAPTQDTSICLGQTVTLKASSATPGATFNWYTVATGGTPVRSGQDTIHVSPSVTTTYYAETVLGGCTSATRTPLKITVIPLPADPELVPDTAYVSQGQTTTFNVVAPVTGITYNWYTTPTGGTSIHTGTSYTTPAITGDAIYYVEAVNANGCMSTNRAKGVVISLTVPTNISCNYANVQKSPVYTGGGLLDVCLLCNVIDPGNAIDGDLNTASNIRMNVGVSMYIGQFVGFQHTGKAGDSIRLVLGLPTGLADVQLLGNVRIETYNNNTPGGGPLFLNSSLLRLKLLSGNKFEAVIPANADYDGVLVSIGGTVSALTTLNLYNAEQLVALPQLADDTVNICEGNSATLSVTGPADVDIKWYDAATGGNLLKSGVSYTTPVLNDTTTYYVESSREGCANPNRVPVIVNVSPKLPAPPVDAASINICANSTATLGVKNPQPGVDYLWYNVAAGGTPLDTGATFTTPALSSNATYYVEALSGGGCAGIARTAVNVVVGTVAADPQLVADTIYATSGQSVTFYALDSSNISITYRWYSVETGGTSIHTGYNFTTPVLTANTIYYVEASSGTGCVSASRTKAVVLISAPTVPDCGFPNAQKSPVYDGLLGGLLALGSVNDPLQAIDNSDATSSQIYSVLNALAFIGQELDFPNTSESGDTLRLHLGLPTGLLDLGVLGRVRIRTYQNNTMQEEFTLNSSLIRLTLLGTTPGKFEANIPVTKSFNKILISLGGLATAVTALDVYSARALVAVPLLTADSVGICSGSTATLEATTTSQNAVIKWYTSATGGTAVATGGTFTTPPLAVTTTYYAEASRNGCANPQRVAATIYVGTPPAVPSVAAGISVCNGESALLKVLNPIDSLTYRWYSTATGGTVLATDSTFTTPALTANTTYYVEAVNGGGCISASRASADVTVNPLPAQPVVVPQSASVPSGGTVSFTVQSPVSGATYNWYGAASGGTPIHTGTSFVTPPLYTSASFYVSAVNATGCASSVRTKVEVTVTGFNGVPCSFATSQLTYGTGLINVATITDPLNAVDADVNTASSIKITASVLGGFGQKLIFPFQGKAGDSIHIKIGGPSTTILQLSLLSGVYVKTFNNITNDNGDAMDLGSSTLINLQLLTSTDSTGLISFKATKDFNSVAIYSTSVLNVNLGNQIDVYYASATVPTPEVTSAAVTVCESDSATLSVKNPVAGVAYRWYSSAVGGTSLHVGTTYTVAPAATSIYYVEASRVLPDTCANPYRTGVTVTVNPAPQSPDVETNDTTICAGNSVILNVKNPQAGTLTYRWYNTATGGVALFTGASYATGALNNDATYYVEAQVTASNCVSLDRTKVNVHVTPLPVAPQLNTTASTICAGDKVTLAVKTPQTGITYEWYTQAAGGTAVHTGEIFTTPALATTITYYVEAVSAGGCMSTARTAAIITVNPLPAIPQVTATPVEVCYGTPAPLKVESPLAGITYRWYLAQTGGTSLHTGITYTTPMLTADAVFYVEAVSANGCISNGRAAVHVKVNALPGITVKAGNISICSGNTAKVEVENNAGVTYKWYATATGGVVLFTGPSYTTPALTATTTYYVEAINGSGCSSADRDSVKVTVNPLPVVPVLEASAVSICGGNSATLKVKNPQTVFVYKWYTTATGGTSVGTGTNFNTPVLTANATYYVEATNPSGCISSARAAGTITINPKAQASDITAAGTAICSGDQATLTASSAVPGAIFTWYSDAQLTKKLVTGTMLKVSPATTTTYYVTVQGTGVCENAPGDGKVVKVTVNPKAKASDITAAGTAICAGDEATLTASSAVPGAIFTWYSDAQLTKKLVTGTMLKASPATTTTYYVTVQGTGVCENAPGDGKAVKVTVNPKAKASDITANDVNICSGEQATLTASSAVPGAIFTWYSDVQLTKKLATGTTLPVTPVTTTTYYVTVQGTGVCENAPGNGKAVKVTVNPKAKASDITANDVNICSGDQATLTASSAVPGAIFTWYSDAQLTKKLVTGTMLKVSPATTTTYYVTVQGMGVCENAPGNGKAVKVTVNPKAKASDITAAGTAICAGDEATLTASSAVPGAIFTWYSDAQLTTKLATGTMLKISPATTTTYYVTVQGTGVCENAPGDGKDVVVTVNIAPSKPTVKGPVGNICGGGTAALQVTNAQAGVTYHWYTTATGGAEVAKGTMFTTPILQADATYYVEAVNGSGCSNASGRTEVKVTVTPIPAAPSVEATQIIACIGNPGTFKIKNPQAGVTYNWFTSATGGAPVSSGENFTTPALQADAVYYVEASMNGGCTSATRTKVEAKVVALPDAPTVNIAANPICPGTTATLTAESATQGVTFRWYDSKTGGNLVSSDNPFITPALNAATTYYVEAVNAGGCINTGGRTEITVQVLMQLPAPQVEVDKANTTGSTVAFTWDPIAGAAGYEVSIDNGATWTQPSSGATGTAHKVTGLQPLESVTIVVRALGQTDCQNSAPSNAVTGKTTNPQGDEVFVPNGFTPNGDGNNDILFVYGNTISSMQLVIYNQFGQKTFESRDQHTGWDGTMNGRMQPVGVYVYYLKATLQDGKKVTKKGSITLIR